MHPNAAYREALRDIVFSQPLWLDRDHAKTLRNPDVGSVLAVHLAETQARRFNYAMKKRDEGGKGENSDSEADKNPNQKNKGTAKKWIHLGNSDKKRRCDFSKVNAALREAMVTGMESVILLPTGDDDQESGTNFTDSDRDS